IPPEEVTKIIQERDSTGYYKPPERAGVSYMLSPILRTYVNPDANDSVATSNIPHVMYYAPNVSNDEMGGAMPTPEQFAYYMQHGRWAYTTYPFVILHGTHGYMLQVRGAEDMHEINEHR